MRIVLRAAVLLAAVACSGQAPEDRRARAARLEDMFLAPCCWSEPVSRHRSEAALQMKVEIARMIGEGKTDREIIDHYKQQYGMRILIEPEGSRRVWAYVVPAAAALVGLGAVVLLLRRWLRPLPESSSG